MNIVSIFERSKSSLYAVKYSGDDKDALELLQEKWCDVEELRVFFNQFRKDYEAYYGKAHINDLVERTIDDADELFETIEELSLDETGKSLNQVFKALHNKEDNTSYELQQLKAYGSQHNTFLRIYAIRFGQSFVITGGAIKLTAKMQDRPHTKTELYKLNLVKDYLLEKDENAEFVYLDI